MKSNQNFFGKLFPTTENLSDAQKVARQGTWAACFVAGMTVVFALISIATPTPLGIPMNAWSLIDAVIFGVIAWGIYRLSRVAAVAALIYYTIGQVSMIAASVESGRKYSVGPVAILMVLAFVNSIRGTFAYHRQRKAINNSADVETHV
jgi:hypothetical protein